MRDLLRAESGQKFGEVSWNELATTDHAAAFTFYQSLFGWTMGEAMDMGPEIGTYQMFTLGGAPLGGMFEKPAQVPGPPHWLYYIRVDDVRAKVDKAVTLGAKLLNGPMEVPGGDMVAQLMDPQGVAFALHSAKK